MHIYEWVHVCFLHYLDGLKGLSVASLQMPLDGGVVTLSTGLQASRHVWEMLCISACFCL